MHELLLIIEMGASDEACNYENRKLHDVCYIVKVTNGLTKRVTVANLVLKRTLRIRTNKYHYKTKITFDWSNVIGCTL